jgi:two-component system, NarL family, invasion response regulator UvrY
LRCQVSAQNEQARSSAAPGRRRGSVHVLTVDDHAPFLRVAREMIRATPGFEPAREVSSGAEALETADALEPDLVLVDVQMPVMNGIETSRRLKASHGEIVVLLVSTDHPGDIPAAARTCGAAAIVPKQDLGPRTLRRLWAAHGPVL